MTAATERHLAKIHTLLCVVHLHCYGLKRNADEAHHLEWDRGAHSDFATIPLCGPCHEELHEKHRKAFMLAHKLTDLKLLAWTVEQLGAA